MTDHTVLALDLSTSRGDLVLMRGSEVIFEESFQSERSHNAQAFAPLRRALAAVVEGPEWVVVGAGPGSYTGVRIAIAIAHGLSLARGARVIAWPSITAPHQKYEEYSVIGDARRGAFYMAAVSGGRLCGGIQLLEAEEARARLERDSDVPWLTFDAKLPLQSPLVRQVHPSAARLAQVAVALSDAELHELGTIPLQPIYLQEAFITTARKPGKQVPIS